MKEERLRSLIKEMEDWVSLTSKKTDWLLKPGEDPKKRFTSLSNYLCELIGWVYDHVCKEDRHDPKWWESHGFTKKEAEVLSE